MSVDRLHQGIVHKVYHLAVIMIKQLNLDDVSGRMNKPPISALI